MADAMRDEFISTLHQIAGDVRFLWVPGDGTGLTDTDYSRHGHTITWGKAGAGGAPATAWATPPSALGAGWVWTFDGVDEEGDVPDNDLFSFGDGQNDQPLSFSYLANFTDATESTILAKSDTDGDNEEWIIDTGVSDKIILSVWDDSSASSLARVSSSAITESVWTNIGGGHEGLNDLSSIRLYQEGARVDGGGAGTTPASYVAMQNETESLSLGHKHVAGADVNFMDGLLGYVLLTATPLSLENHVAIKHAVNAFYDLTL